MIGGVVSWLGFTLPSAIALVLFALAQRVGRPLDGGLAPRPEARRGRGRRPGRLPPGPVADARLAPAGRGACRYGCGAPRGDPVLAARDHRRRGGHRVAGTQAPGEERGGRRRPGDVQPDRPAGRNDRPWAVLRPTGRAALATGGDRLAGRGDGRDVLPDRVARLRRRPRRPAAARCGSRRSGLGRRGPIPRRIRRGPSRPGTAVLIRGVSRGGRRATARWLGRRGGCARLDLPAVVPAHLWCPAVLGSAATIRGVQAGARRHECRGRGLLAAALYRPIWTGAVESGVDVVIAVAGLGLLVIGRVPPVVVVVAAAVAGQVMRA